MLGEMQLVFARRLQDIDAQRGAKQSFQGLEWLRDEGRHGGGFRYAAALTPAFNRAALNVSCVHYDDEPQKRLMLIKERYADND